MRNKGLNIIKLRYLILLFLSIFLYDSTAFAQLNENCTVSILNRTSRVKEDGTWGITNVPSNFGEVRARATCVEEGQTLSGQSDLITIPTDGDIEIPTITLGSAVPIPETLTITSPVNVLT